MGNRGGAGEDRRGFGENGTSGEATTAAGLGGSMEPFMMKRIMSRGGSNVRVGPVKKSRSKVRSAVRLGPNLNNRRSGAYTNLTPASMLPHNSKNNIAGLTATVTSGIAS